MKHQIQWFFFFPNIFKGHKRWGHICIASVLNPNTAASGWHLNGFTRLAPISLVSHLGGLDRIFSNSSYLPDICFYLQRKKYWYIHIINIYMYIYVCVSVCRVRIELDYYQQTACLTVPHPTQSIMCRRNNATRRQYNIVALMLYICRKSSHDCGDYECSHYVLCCVVCVKKKESATETG